MQKLNLVKIESLDKPIILEEIKISKNYPHKKVPGPDGSQGNSSKFPKIWHLDATYIVSDHFKRQKPSKLFLQSQYQFQNMTGCPTLAY